LLLVACEHVDLEDEETVSSATDLPQIVPVGHGRGSQELPYTVGELLDGKKPQTSANCWVMGYAVGSTQSSFSNALFEVPTAYYTNILLSDDSLCTDAEQCIAIELSTKAMQEKFSLDYYPEGFRQFVVVSGTFGQYFRHVGFRKVQQGYWIPGFDLGTILSSPTTWDEVEENF